MSCKLPFHRVILLHTDMPDACNIIICIYLRRVHVNLSACNHIKGAPRAENTPAQLGEQMETNEVVFPRLPK